MKFKTIAASILLLALTACGDDDPKALSEKIDAMSGKNYPMTDEQKADVDRLTAQGRELLGQGKTEDSKQVFEQALAILKQAEDADLYNKAD